METKDRKDRKLTTEVWWPDGWPERRQIPGTDLEHGTVKGYGHHRRHDASSCVPCREAWNVYQKEHRLALRATKEQENSVTENAATKESGKTRIGKNGFKITPKRANQQNNLRIYQLAMRRLAAEHPAELEFFKEEVIEELREAGEL